MITLTLKILQACFPEGKASNLEKFVTGFNETFEDFEINTTNRMAMFLAQTAHESGIFSATVENLNYNASGLTRTWPSRFPASIANQYARNQEMIANRAYCDRMGNGNEASGDGWKYRGRGVIQLTGKDNYRACGKALGLDLISNPDSGAQSPVVVLSAGWFWNTRKLNDWSDRGDVVTVTKRINGGTNGLSDRTKHYKHALEVLEAGPS